MDLTIDQEERIENAKEAIAAGEMDCPCCAETALDKLIELAIGPPPWAWACPKEDV